ncbi:hypothetical protein B566_EDAN005515 [Ephemera danica]|nr:hypothetical protein B566_EDAN005515 [Ephemera danica]
MIINLPGSTKGSVEMATFALPGIPHAVSLLRDDKQSVKAAHDKIQSSHCHHHCHNQADSSVDLTQVARRARESPYPMVEMDKAVAMVLQHAKGLASPITVPLRAAVGFVTAQSVRASEDLPPFRASVKDGYAVITADGAGPRQVVGNSFAGNPLESCELKSGQCARVTTGAPVPAGSDAVVQVEDTKLLREADEGKTELEIEILKAPSLGQDIRPIGSDMKKGQIVVEQNAVLNSPQIGLIAASGVSEVQVYSLPQVAVLSTGDEVQDPGLSSRPGCIFDSNRPMLLALLQQNGFPVHDMGIILDDPGEVLSKLREAMNTCDVVITSGGVSMGEKDYLKQVLVKDLGAQIHFGRVQMKPGKPTTFATCQYQGKKKLLFALPGNPVSAAVTSYLFTLPALRAMAGCPNPDNTFNITAKLGSEVRLDPRPEYCRAVLEWPKPPSAELPTAHLTGHQASSRLLSMHSANVLLVLPPRTEQQKLLPAGTLVSAMILMHH